MIRKALCWAVVGLVVVGFLGGLTSAENVIPVQKSTPVVQTRAYTPHAPIRIEGNSQFTPNATNGIKKGNGTLINPYIIEGWKIDPQNNNNATCVYIGNTSLFLKIQNCMMLNSTKNGTGIELNNTSNCEIINNNIIDSKNGLLMFNGNNCSLNDNLFQDTNNGIWVSMGNNITITTNNITSSIGYGIALFEPIKTKILNNNISFCGTGIFCKYTNKIIYSSNVFSNDNLGMNFQGCLECTLNNNRFLNNHVYLYTSDNMNISHNFFSENNSGIYLSYSIGNRIL